MNIQVSGKAYSSKKLAIKLMATVNLDGSEHRTWCVIDPNGYMYPFGDGSFSWNSAKQAVRFSLMHDKGSMRGYSFIPSEEVYYPVSK